MKRNALVTLAAGFVLGISTAAAAYTHNHGTYTPVLGEYLTDGRVDYTALQAGRAGLDRYVERLGEVTDEQYARMTDEEKIAFWLNAYNAITLKVIIDHYPIRPSGLKGLFVAKNSILQIPGAWDRIRHRVRGEDLTLNEIEHEILRKEFSEPRIHFALVCASIGCPDLRDEPYTGARLENQLEDQTRLFLADPAKSRYDAENDTLYLSPIFKWFKEDFEPPGGPREFVKRYLPDTEAVKISSETRLRYLNYDWNLNDRRGNDI